MGKHAHTQPLTAKMTEEQKQVETVAAPEEAPAPPASLPPTEENVEAKTEETAAPAAEEQQAEKEKPKVSRRFTFNKRWGKHRDEPQVPKEPEQPKDPKEDVLGWIAQQIPQAVHKVNYHILEWVQNTAVENEADRKALPGKDGSVTRNQLLVFLRDGDLLTKLANKLQAGAIEPAVLAEGADAAAQKDAQKKNIDSFSEWAETSLGLQKDQVLSSADLLDKGKNGYPAVFNTLWQLGVQAKDKFQADGFDVDAIINAASQVVKSNIIQTILGFFRFQRNRAAAVEETKEAAAAEGEAAAATEEAAAVADVEEPVQKIETSAPSAVAAN